MSAVPDTSSVLYPLRYAESITQYRRRRTIEVKIGDVPLGAHHPIRVQSMTTVDTMDTLGSVEQTIRMVNAGCEYVRITAPSVNEARNLENIRKELRKRGYQVPLIADIHFTPNAAELAARIVEKVRINPGNYADKKKFEVIDYSDAAYEAELHRIREKFLPLVRICKEYGTAMRIGTNHGSLSDRILSRYGDTPLGMVESALEFLRICEDEQYYNIVLSMKASNTQVMVQAYRLLVDKLQQEGFKPYPLHLGVTEAGDGEDGRIKSAVGIGALLEDGLGDTVRVSLTEEPEFEAPVARALIDRYAHRSSHQHIKPIDGLRIDPYQYHRRKTHELLNFGGGNVPRVIADFSHSSNIEIDDLRSVGHFYFSLTDKWNMNDLGADYIYTGDHPVQFMFPNGLKEIVNYKVWTTLSDRKHIFPLLKASEYLNSELGEEEVIFLSLQISDLDDPSLLIKLEKEKRAVLIIHTDNDHAYAELRRLFFELIERAIQLPVVVNRPYQIQTGDISILYASTDVGGLLIDGLGDGIMLSTPEIQQISKPDQLEWIKNRNSVSFGILQAARTRMSKTEYISCPSCGRTLFDLQETTAMIRKRTDHLKGVKIGIMGCIVNGPGEMADADYGYVGSGVGKITLYKGQEVVKRNVPSEKAVDELIEIIRQDGNWIEPAPVL
jgi:(E)-4-hydroxy-3-methylbut-2-enyl-diphosphate synthase